MVVSPGCFVQAAHSKEEMQLDFTQVQSAWREAGEDFLPVPSLSLTAPLCDPTAACTSAAVRDSSLSLSLVI